MVGDDLRHGTEEAAEVVGVVLGEPGAARGVVAEVDAILRVVGADHAQEVAGHLAGSEAEVLRRRGGCGFRYGRCRIWGHCC